MSKTLVPSSVTLPWFCSTKLRNAIKFFIHVINMCVHLGKMRMKLNATCTHIFILRSGVDFYVRLHFCTFFFLSYTHTNTKHIYCLCGVINFFYILLFRILFILNWVYVRKKLCSNIWTQKQLLSMHLQTYTEAHSCRFAFRVHVHMCVLWLK